MSRSSRNSHPREHDCDYCNEPFWCEDPDCDEMCGRCAGNYFPREDRENEWN